MENSYSDGGNLWVVSPLTIPFALISLDDITIAPQVQITKISRTLN